MQVSKKIFAFDHDDRISEIRNEVSSHIDAIPYMLLPVRIETKFREIKLTAALTEMQVESILEAIGEIHLITIEVINKINAIKIRLIITRLGDVTAAIKSVNKLQVQEKGWIKQVYNALKIDLLKVVEMATSAFPPEAAQLRIAMATFDDTLIQAPTVKDKSDILSTWIQELSLHDSGYALLAGPIAAIPFINVKNKKDLYIYLERKFQNLFDFFGKSKEVLSAVKNIDLNQLNTIKKHHTQLSETNGKVVANLATIHADTSWQKFIQQKIEPNTEQFAEALKIFVTETIPFLETLPPPPPIQSGDLIVHGVLTLVKLKKFNTDPSEGIEKQKRFRKYLQPRIELLQKSLSNTVNETRVGHIDTIKRMYGSLGESLQETSQKISAFNTTNKSQAFGNKVTRNFIIDKVSPIVDALKGQAIPGIFPGAVIIPKEPEIERQLCIRIYPDDIMIMTHEPKLTENEVKAGQQFWKSWWAASRDRDMEKAAWSVITARFGTKRASWIVKSLKPDINFPVNKAAFDIRPSDKITDIINLIQGNIDLSKKLPDSKPSVLFTTAETVTTFKSMLVTLEKALSLIKTLSSEQDFFISKLNSLNIQASSQLNSLIEKSHTLTEAEIQLSTNALSELETILLRTSELNKLTGELVKTDPVIFTNALTDPFVYPEVELKDKEWNNQPVCGGMPDRFVAITMNGSSYQHIKVGNAVTENLPVGIDPNAPDNDSNFKADAEGNLQIPDSMKWMFDYDKAVEEGMGITLKLTAEQYESGFDRVIVIGTKNSDAAAGQAAAEKLFTNHIYSEDGLDFLKTGTPTNNTEQRKSGYKIDADSDERYRIEIESAVNTTIDTDGKRFARALGISESVVNSANYSGNTEINKATRMNRALFNGTLGHYMEEMFDTIFTYDNIRRTERLFTDFCLGRGSLPSIRTGMQPYGILPTTAFSWLQMDTHLRPLSVAEMSVPFQTLSELNFRIQSRFEYRLHQLLMILYREFRSLVDKNVITYANLEKAGADVSDRFTQMLCLHPVSMNYFFRQSINIARGPNATEQELNSNFRAEDPFGPVKLFDQFKLHMFSGVNNPSLFFYDEASPDPIKSLQTDKVFSRIKEQFITSRNFGNRALDITSPITGEIVTEEPSLTDPLPKEIGTGPGAINYIEWILSRKADELLGGNALDDPARIPNTSMLFLMLRQSLLQAYQEAALEILQKESFFNEYTRRALGSRFRYYFKRYNFVTKTYKNVYVTKWHPLFKHFDTLPEILQNSGIVNNPFFQFINNGTVKSMARYLDQVRGPEASYQLFAPTHKVHFDKLRKVREAIASLSTLPTAELELLLGEHVDICTHRLDAWLLSLVNQRLFLQRAGRPTGLFMGAYGYVENLRRDKNRGEYSKKVHEEFNIKPEEKIFFDQDNQGFIHAPSIGQAITAAIMRSAYMGNISGEDEKNRLSVNLSSSRVRMALKLIEGLNNNQSVNALLGFQFEKGLHERYREAEMDKFIQPLRKKFPLKQKVEETAQEQATYESLVVDGLALLEKCQDLVNWDELKDIQTLGELLENNFPADLDTLVNGLVPSGPLRVTSRKIIIEEIDRMADAFDSLGDLALSESVYQIVQGNHVRAAAVLEALASGRNLPEPEIINTLRSGNVVTHKVVLNLPTKMPGTGNEFSAPTGWPAGATLLASAEPSLNSFIGNAVGPATNFKCLVTTTDNAEISTQSSLGLEELNLQPIDLFSMTGGMEELKEIIIHRLVRKDDPQTKVQVDFNSTGPGGTSAHQPFSRLFHLLKKITSLLANAKPAGASDMVLPQSVTDHSNEGNFNVSELEQRIFKVFDELQSLTNTIAAENYIKDVLDGKTAADKVALAATDYTNMLGYLDRAMFVGISNAYGSGLIIIPDNFDHFYAVHQQLLLVTKELINRLAAATALKNTISTITKPSLRVQKLQELAKAIMGRNKTVLPVYQLINTPKINDQLSLGSTEKLTRFGGRMAMEKWMQGLSRVRNSINHLMSYLQWKDMMGHSPVKINPVQLPYKKDDYWLGIEYPANYSPKGDHLSIVLIEPERLQTQTWNAGLVLDEWVEIIPVKEETSGIVFNYNQPNATPPQSILLAVTPSVNGRWEWDDLVHTITDTVELCRIRAVEPDHINQSYLSLALNAVVGEIPPPQVEGEDENALGVQAVMDLSFIKKTE
ncbi:MAG: hypothetical protein ACXWV5_01410 [Flavitalea sp.]